MKKLILSAAASAAFIASPASAALFDFTTIPVPGVELGTTQDYTVDGITITASFFDNNVAVNGYEGFFGLGVSPNNNSVDSTEEIRFSFGPNIRINSVTLNELPDRPGDVSVSYSLGAGPELGTSFDGSTTLLFNTIADSAIFSNASAAGDGPYFRIASIDVSQVPLPGAALLFGSVLAAAGAMRRFRKTTV